MAWNGAGVFSRTNGAQTGSTTWQDSRDAGNNILASQHDTHDEDLATGINNCLTKDGQNSPTANLPMGGYAHTGVGNGTTRTHYAAVGQVQDSGLIHATSGGTANAQTLTLAPVLPAYKAGQIISFIAGSGLTNTGAATMNVNTLGARSIYKPFGPSLELVAGDIEAGGAYTLVDNGSAYQLLGASRAVAKDQDVTVVSTTSKTNLMAYTFPQDSLLTERGVLARISGTFTNSTGVAQTITWGGTFGTTALFTYAQSVANGVTGSFILTVDLGMLGAVDAESATTRLITNAATGSSAISPTDNVIAGLLLGEDNSAGSLAFNLNVTLGVSSASFSITMDYGEIILK